jgi:hypothetical protein
MNDGSVCPKCGKIARVFTAAAIQRDYRECFGCFTVTDIYDAELNSKLAAAEARVKELEGEVERLRAIEVAAKEYTECEGRRYDTTEHQQIAIRAINKLYAALARPANQGDKA